MVTSPGRRLDRRRFLCAAGAATVAAVAGGVAARRVPEADPGAIAAPDLPVGAARAVPLSGGEALVVRGDPTTTVAFDRRCPHLGCPVVWAAARGRFECPCHRAAFDARSGAVLFGPPDRGLTPIEVKHA